jgi:hypothetical protein
VTYLLPRSERRRGVIARLCMWSWIIKDVSSYKFLLARLSSYELRFLKSILQCGYLLMSRDLYMKSRNCVAGLSERRVPYLGDSRDRTAAPAAQTGTKLLGVGRRSTGSFMCSSGIVFGCPFLGLTTHVFYFDSFDTSESYINSSLFSICFGSTSIVSRLHVV